MADLIGKLLNIISDPVVVTVVVSFGITITVLWKLFEKQHDFIRERVELLRQENEDLRRQVQIFREENDRLRKVSTMLVNAVEDLRAQPMLTQKQLDELRAISETAKQAAAQNIPATRALIDKSSLVVDEIRHIVEINQHSLMIQKDGFNQLAAALEQRGSNQEILKILSDLIEIVGHSQQKLSDSIMQLEERVQKIKRD